MEVFESTIDQTFETILANFYLTLIILSVSCNVFVISVLLSIHHERRFRDFILLSQSLADITRIIFSGVEEYKGLKNNKFQDNEETCTAFALFTEAFEIVAVGHALLLVTDRYLCACKQNVALSMYTKRRYIVISVSLIYCYALLWSILPVLGFGTYGLQENGIQCGLVTKYASISDQVFFSLSILSIMVIPLVAILYLTHKVFIAIQDKRRNTIIGSSSSQTNILLCYIKQDRDHMTLVKAITLAFLITWMPYNIVLALEMYGVTINDAMKYCELVTGFLSHTSTLVTPILYMVFYKDLQATLRFYYKKCCTREKVIRNNVIDINGSEGRQSIDETKA